MDSDWVQSLAFCLIGFAGGFAFCWYALGDIVERHVTRQVREANANKKKLQLERNGRDLPKRDDAAPGASRIHKVSTKRNLPNIRRIDR